MRDYLHYKNRKTKTSSRIKPLRVIAYLLGFAGLCFIASGIFFIKKPSQHASITKENKTQAKMTPEHSKKPQAPQTTKALTKDKKLSFDFYHILPQRKTLLNTNAASSQESDTSKPSTNSFSIQVASYRQKEQAQKLSALLKKWQLPARISHQDKQDWFAVIIGPCAQMRDCEAYQNLLQKKGLHGSLIRSEKTQTQASLGQDK